MTDWKLLIEESQKGDWNSTIEIINRFRPKIKSSLRQTTNQERENLEQELIAASISAINSFNTKEVPGFWEFISNRYE